MSDPAGDPDPPLDYRNPDEDRDPNRAGKLVGGQGGGDGAGLEDGKPLAAQQPRHQADGVGMVIDEEDQRGAWRRGWGHKELTTSLTAGVGRVLS